MKYKSFSKFISERKAAQVAQRENEMIGNRVSRSFVKQEQKCSQFTGHQKTACLYGQTDESYIMEQANNASKLAALNAAIASIPAPGKPVPSGPYAGKMKGELRVLRDTLQAAEDAAKAARDNEGDTKAQEDAEKAAKKATQVQQNVETISSADIGGGLRRSEDGTVSIDREAAQKQRDEFMQGVADRSQGGLAGFLGGGGKYNPETGKIEFGASIPLVSTGNFFSVGKEGDMETNYGNIAQTVGQTALMAIPGGAAVGALGRGGAAAVRGVQGIRGARNIRQAQMLAKAAAQRRAGAAVAGDARLAAAGRQGADILQRQARTAMQQGMRQTAQATRGQAVGQGRAALTGLGNTISGAATGARLGSAPLRGAARLLRGPASRAGSALVSPVQTTRNALVTAGRLGRLGVYGAGLGVGADLMFNDGQLTNQAIASGMNAAGFGPAVSRPEDRPTTATPATQPPATQQQPTTEPTTQQPSPGAVSSGNGQSNAQSTSGGTNVPTQNGTQTRTGTQTGTGTATTAAATTAAATPGGGTSSRQQPNLIPITDKMTAEEKKAAEKLNDEERQRVATKELERSQRERNIRDFRTDAPTQQQLDMRSAARERERQDRRGAVDALLNDPNSDAMKAAEREIAAVAERNKMRQGYKGPASGINQKTADQIRRKYAQQYASRAGAAAGGAAGGAIPGGAVGGVGTDRGTADLTAATTSRDAILTPEMINATNRLFADPTSVPSQVADLGDRIARFNERMGISSLTTPGILAAAGLYGVDPRALGADKVDVSQNLRAPSTERVDPNAAPPTIANVQTTGSAGQQVTTTGAGMVAGAVPERAPSEVASAAARSKAMAEIEQEFAAKAKAMDPNWKTGMVLPGTLQQEMEARMMNLRAAGGGAGGPGAVPPGTAAAAGQTVAQMPGAQPGPATPFQQNTTSTRRSEFSGLRF